MQNVIKCNHYGDNFDVLSNFNEEASEVCTCNRGLQTALALLEAYWHSKVLYVSSETGTNLIQEHLT